MDFADRRQEWLQERASRPRLARESSWKSSWEAEARRAREIEAAAEQEFAALPLHRAVQCRTVSADELRRLVLLNPAQLRATDADGMIPLVLAIVCEKDIAVLNVLAELSSDAINHVEITRNCRTPLHEAVAARAPLAVVHMLISRGADVKLEDEDGMTARDLAGMLEMPQEYIDVLCNYGSRTDRMDSFDFAALLLPDDVDDEYFSAAFQGTDIPSFDRKRYACAFVHEAITTMEHLAMLDKISLCKIFGIKAGHAVQIERNLQQYSLLRVHAQKTAAVKVVQHINVANDMHVLASSLLDHRTDDDAQEHAVAKMLPERTPSDNTTDTAVHDLQDLSSSSSALARSNDTQEHDVVNVLQPKPTNTVGDDSKSLALCKKGDDDLACVVRNGLLQQIVELTHQSLATTREQSRAIEKRLEHFMWHSQTQLRLSDEKIRALVLEMRALRGENSELKDRFTEQELRLIKVIKRTNELGSAYAVLSCHMARQGKLKILCDALRAQGHGQCEKFLLVFYREFNSRIRAEDLIRRKIFCYDHKRFGLVSDILVSCTELLPCAVGVVFGAVQAAVLHHESRKRVSQAEKILGSMQGTISPEEFALRVATILLQFSGDFITARSVEEEVALMAEQCCVGVLKHLKRPKPSIQQGMGDAAQEEYAVAEETALELLRDGSGLLPADARHQYWVSGFLAFYADKSLRPDKAAVMATAAMTARPRQWLTEVMSQYAKDPNLVRAVLQT